MVINNYVKMENYYILTIIKTDKETAEVLIDEEDYLKCKALKWTFRRRNQHYCVKCTTKIYANTPLHQFLIGKPETGVIDHINKNGLDNRKMNLRVTSYSINSSNAHARTESKTNIRGVYKRKVRPGVAKASWVCEWSIEGKRHTRSFSIDKYGEEKAFELAFNLRKQKEKEMKI